MRPTVDALSKAVILPLARAALLSLFVLAAARADLACIPERSVVSADDRIRVRAFDPDPAASAVYEWSASAGAIQGKGREAVWRLTGIRPMAEYKATVVRRTPSGASDCSVTVVAGSGGRGDRETGRVLLARGGKEAPGYGLYSYFLLGSPPADDARKRTLEAIRCYLRLSPALSEMSQFLEPKQLNANYLPVMRIPEGEITAESLLASYDFARARAILKTLPGSLLRGPYLLSLSAPADPAGPAHTPYLLQDLSTVTSELIGPWYEAFLNQAAQERFASGGGGRQFTLRMRTLIAVLAEGLPDVKSGLDSWIKWAQ